MIDRRALMGVALSAAAAPVAAQSAASPGAAPSWPPREVWPLWPGPPPGATATVPTPSLTVHGPPERRELWQTGVAVPTLNLFRPARPNGAAILCLPGGSYRILSVTNEGRDAADRFTALGFTVAVLSYRLPDEGWANRADVPLQDAQRALRLLRARAGELLIDPARIGVLGFSAGGHLAASLAVSHAEPVYAPVDAADALAARPAFAALLYPVISLRPPLAHGESRDRLLGPAPSEALIDRRSPARRVDAATPPTFLAHAIDDATVPVDNTLEMLAALRAKAIPAEAHLFQQGGHGFGLHAPSALPAARWPDLAAAWIARVLAA
ncbi:MAG: alpha/beta hydrolase [Caulobacter sp.]|nr:alpha/beta hydrolase [Caulobacter sp.]